MEIQSENLEQVKEEFKDLKVKPTRRRKTASSPPP